MFNELTTVSAMTSLIYNDVWKSLEKIIIYPYFLISEHFIFICAYIVQSGQQA